MACYLDTVKNQLKNYEAFVVDTDIKEEIKTKSSDEFNLIFSKKKRHPSGGLGQLLRSCLGETAFLQLEYPARKKREDGTHSVY